MWVTMMKLMTLTDMHRFKELLVWQFSKGLAVEIFKITQKFPKSALYSIGDQIRKSSLSIPSNIAEGAGRSSNQQFAYFLNVALGSAYELETQLLIAAELAYGPQKSFEKCMNDLKEVQNMLIGLRRSLA